MSITPVEILGIGFSKRNFFKVRVNPRLSKPIIMGLGDEYTIKYVALDIEEVEEIIEAIKSVLSSFTAAGDEE